MTMHCLDFKLNGPLPAVPRKLGRGFLARVVVGICVSFKKFKSLINISERPHDRFVINVIGALV